MLNVRKLNFTPFLLTFSCMVMSTTYVHARSTHHTSHKKTTHTTAKKQKATLKKVSLKRVTHNGKNKHSHFSTRKVRYTHRSGGGRVIQCVAFARSASDIQLRGNAGTWWNKADGVYDRGNNPQPESILSFRSTRKMPMGHVAVVKQVVDSRTIIIDQSHWAQRGISRNTTVVDVSPNNDWTAVRVATKGSQGSFGSIYPTHGFIYPSAPSDSTPVQQAKSRNNPYKNIRTWSADAASTKGYSKTNTQVALAPNVSQNFFNDAPNRDLK